MESYYSSDEDIAWGPVTLREIKGDLKRRAVKKPHRRYSVDKDFKMYQQPHSHMCHDASSEVISRLSKEISNKLNISPTSTEYYTPNESLITENNCDFLGKLAKAINEPKPDSSTLDSTKTSLLTNDFSTSITNSECVNSSYYSTKDHITNVNDSYFNLIKIASERNTSCDIANFQQTLIKSPNTESLSLIDEDSLCENDSIDPDTSRVVGTGMGDVVIVSDDDGSDTQSNDVEICDSLNSDISIEEKIYELDMNNENEGWFSNNQICEMKEYNEINEANDIIPTIQIFPPQEIRSFSDSPISLPDIDLAQFDDTHPKSDSPHLDCTLEEINKLLSDGLNYTVSDNESIIESTPQKNESRLDLQFTPSNIISGSFIHTPIHNSDTGQKTPLKTNQLSEKNFYTFDIKRTPDSTRSNVKKMPDRFDIKRNRFDIKTPDSNFKIPERPVRTKLTIPTPPKLTPNNLKNVISPVALYIKNSPNVPLRQNLPHRELHKIVTATKIPMPSAKKNLPDLPEVTYKPSKKQISSREKEVVLPASIRRLNVKEPNVVKHEGRIHQSVNRVNASWKLLQTDITNNVIDLSVLDNSKDVSVLTSKQAFIK